jgi:hypothetical protein
MKQTMIPHAIRPEYKDSDQIYEQYADATRFVNFDGNAVKIELVVLRGHLQQDNSIAYTCHPSVRLAVSLQCAMVLHEQLSVVLKKLQDANLLPLSPNVPSSEKKQ